MAQSTKTFVKNSRNQLLLATSLSAIVLGSVAAQSNDLLYSGPSIDGVNNSSPFFILATPTNGLNENTEVRVNTQSLTSPSIEKIRVVGWDGKVDITVDKGFVLNNGVTGIYATTTKGDVTTVLNGDIGQAIVNGIVQDTRFGFAGGNNKVTGSGNIDVTGWGVWLLSDTGSNTVDMTGNISGGLGGIVVESITGAAAIPAGPSGDTTVTVNTLKSSAGFGAWLLGNEGKTVFTSNGTIDANTVGVLASTVSGNMEFNTNALVTAKAAEGFLVTSTTGDLTFKTKGGIKSGTEGIEAAATSGDILADGVGSSIDAGGYGAFLNTAAGDISVQNYTKGITAGVDAVYAASNFGGNILVDSNGPLKGLEGVEAIALGTDGSNGDITISKNASITGTLVDAVRATSSGGGDIKVVDNGIIDGKGYGVKAATAASNATNGNVTVTGNGPTTGQVFDGILAHALLGGDVVVKTGGASKGLVYGINALTTDGFGAGTIDVDADHNVSGTTGIIALGQAGTVLVDVASGVTVQGNGAGWGVVTGTTTGTATTTNNGIIKESPDTGAANTVGEDAFNAISGNVVLDNKASGQVIGRVWSSAVNFDFNNAGTWIAGTGNNPFGGADDVVNNTGKILIRDGATVFTALEDFNNLAGGIVDLTYSSGTNEILTVLNFDPQGGGILKFDLDFAGAGGLGDDHTSYGSGNADTIYVASNVTPAGVTTIDLAVLNRATQNNLIATSGSIALVNSSAAADLLDPGLGGLPLLIASDNYVFANDPSSGAVKFVLQEDTDGGVFLRWAPNITAATLGAYGAGPIGDDAAAAANMGAAGAGISGGAGGGMGPGGGASGGGAAGQVADLASSNASGGSGLSGASGGAFCGDGSRNGGFVTADGSKTKFDGGTKGWSANGAVGVERDFSADACGQIAFGAFATLGAAGTKTASGSSDLSTKGVGGYARFGAGTGFYATALGAVNWGDTDIKNNIFGSTANQNSFGYMGNLAVGYAAKVSDSTVFDLRAYASAGKVDGDGFTDTAGIVLDGSKARMKTVGAMVGLQTALSDDVSAFARVGARHVWLEQSMSAFGIKVSGKNEMDFAGIEAGLNYKLTNSGVLSVSGNSDFSKNSTSWGGKIGASFKF
jgi:hypothetical protein